MHMKMSSAQWRHICFGLNVFIFVIHCQNKKFTLNPGCSYKTPSQVVYVRHSQLWNSYIYILPWEKCYIEPADRNDGWANHLSWLQITLLDINIPWLDSGLSMSAILYRRGEKVLCGWIIINMYNCQQIVDRWMYDFSYQQLTKFYFMK